MSGSAVVAVCRECGGMTGVACGGPYDHNDIIAEWIERDDRIDARSVEAARSGVLCSCPRCRVPEPANSVSA